MMLWHDNLIGTRWAKDPFGLYYMVLQDANIPGFVSMLAAVVDCFGNLVQVATVAEVAR